MVPFSGSEYSDFSPPSLANLEPRPTFRFRPATPRAKRLYQHAIISHGLRSHGPDAVQSEILHALRNLWAGDEEGLAQIETQFRVFWETQRQAAIDPTVMLDEGEARDVAIKIGRLADNWPMLRQMNADNLLFSQDAPKIALGMFLAGWTGLETPFRLHDGRVPMETLDALEEEMDEIEAKAIENRVEGVFGGAMMEACSHALDLMTLGKSAEKNLPSLSLPSDTPNGSTADGSGAKTTPSSSGTSPSQPGKSRASTKPPAKS